MNDANQPSLSQNESPRFSRRSLLKAGGICFMKEQCLEKSQASAEEARSVGAGETLLLALVL